MYQHANVLDLPQTISMGHIMPDPVVTPALLHWVVACWALFELSPRVRTLGSKNHINRLL